MSRKIARSERGFTLVELLLVVTIIAVLVGLILPVVAGLRTKAKSTQCRSAMNQFGKSLSLYANDQSDYLPPNRVGMVPIGQVGQTWVSGWVAPRSPDGTNRWYLHQSLLWEYVKRDELWKCPGDASQIVLDGKEYDRVRSMSMNYYMGANWTIETRQTYRKLGGINSPSPSDAFVFTDERPETIGDGAFVVDPAFNTKHPADWRLIDLPGNFHGASTGMAFADGHAEIHLWKDQRTAAASYPYQSMGFNADMQWLDVHSSAPPGTAGR